MFGRFDRFIATVYEFCERNFKTINNVSPTVWTSLLSIITFQMFLFFSITLSEFHSPDVKLRSNRRVRENRHSQDTRSKRPFSSRWPYWRRTGDVTKIKWHVLNGESFYFEARDLLRYNGPDSKLTSICFLSHATAQLPSAELSPKVIHLETDSLSVVRNWTCSSFWTELNYDSGSFTNETINRLSVNQVCLLQIRASRKIVFLIVIFKQITLNLLKLAIY